MSQGLMTGGRLGCQGPKTTLRDGIRIPVIKADWPIEWHISPSLSPLFFFFLSFSSQNWNWGSASPITEGVPMHISKIQNRFRGGNLIKDQLRSRWDMILPN